MSLEGNHRIRKVGRILNIGTKSLLTKAAFIGTWPTRRIEDALNIVYGYDKDSGLNPPVNTRAISVFITCLFLSSLITYYSFQYTALREEAAWMAGIFSLACLLWTTEALPLFATSILIIGLQIIFLSNPGSWPGIGFENTKAPDFKFFLEPLSDPIIVLFFGGFLLAKAAVKRGVDASLASLVLRLFGATPSRVLLGMMLITAFFSMWMSNTATTTMMLALLIPLFSQIPEEKKFQKGLLLSIPFAANIGGMGTPIASPPNAVAIGYLNSIGLNVSFTQWMLLSIPLVLVMLLVAYQILWKKYSPTNKDNKIILEKKPIDSKGKFVVLVFITSIGLWLTEGYHGLPTAVVALIPAIAFTATGLLTKYDINNLDWNILILIAGGIALGKGMSITGLDQALGSFFPKNSNYLFSLLILGSLIFSTLISNTATANLLIPVGVSLATSPEGGVDSYMAKEIAIGIALIASMAMSLPVSTAPNTIAYSQGKLETKDFFKVGSLLGVCAMGLIIAAATVLNLILTR